MEKRWLIFFAVFTVAYFVLIAPTLTRRPQNPTASPNNTPDAAQTEATPAGPDSTPAAEGTPAVASAAPDAPQVTTPPSPSVTMREAPKEVVETGLVRVELSRLGAVPTSWVLQPTKKLAEVKDFDRGTTTVMELVPQIGDPADREYPLQLAGKTAEEFNKVLYEVERSVAQDGVIELRFTSPPIEDVTVVKTYRFNPSSYVTDLVVEVRNGKYRTRLGDSDVGWGLGWQGGFMQPHVLSRTNYDQIFSSASVDGKLRLKELAVDDEPIVFVRNVAWAGQESKYFAALLVPDPANPGNSVQYAVRQRNISAEYQIKGVHPPTSVTIYHAGETMEPGESTKLVYRLVAAPKNYNDLVSLSKTIPMAAGSLPLSAVVFGKMLWGQDWMRPICIVLLRALHGFAGLVKNWGLSIILLVLVVKIVLYPLSHWAIVAQAKTMAEQKKIKPLLDKLNEKYKDDPSKKSQEMMKLYREHNINPLGAMRGCLPMLLQMPIFFALYILLAQAVELRGQDFLWIKDLAQPDRLIPFGDFRVPLLGWNAFNILPILMAVSQYFSTRMSMTNVSDPMQRQMMTMMPIFFIFIMYGMPAGLMLYWTVQNVWQIGHTALTKRYVAMHDQPPGGTPAAQPAAT